MGNQNWKHGTPNLLKEGLKITKSSSSISATCLKWVLKSDCMSTGKVKSCRTRLGCWGFWRLYGTIFIFFVQIKWLYCRYTDEEYYKTWISTRRTRISDLSWWKGLCVLRDMHHDFKQIKALSIYCSSVIKKTYLLFNVCLHCLCFSQHKHRIKWKSGAYIIFKYVQTNAINIKTANPIASSLGWFLLMYKLPSANNVKLSLFLRVDESELH